MALPAYAARAINRTDLRCISPALHSWYDFSDTATLTLDGSGNIQTINDKSGNARHATQATSTLRPAVGAINGLTAAQYVTVNSDMELRATVASSLPVEVCAVAVSDITAGINYECIVSSLGANNGGLQTIGATNWVWQYAVNFTGWATNGVRTTAAYPTIRSPFVQQIWGWAGDGWSYTQIGQDRTIYQRNWKGRIGELALFNRALTTQERDFVKYSMARKWGIAVA